MLLSALEIWASECHFRIGGVSKTRAKIQVLRISCHGPGWSKMSDGLRFLDGLAQDLCDDG